MVVWGGTRDCRQERRRYRSLASSLKLNFPFLVNPPPALEPQPYLCYLCFREIF